MRLIIALSYDRMQTSATDLQIVSRAKQEEKRFWPFRECRFHTGLALGSRLRLATASLHMACCPSARLNLLSIPLMVARDRNSASLTVKCHKFLRLVQFVALYLPSRNKQSDLLSRAGYQVVEASDSVGDRRRESSCCCCKRIVKECQEYGAWCTNYHVQVVRQPVAAPMVLLILPHDHKRMVKIFVTRFVPKCKAVVKVSQLESDMVKMRWYVLIWIMTIDD